MGSESGGLVGRREDGSRERRRDRHESRRGEGGKADGILHGKYCRKGEKTVVFYSHVPVQPKDRWAHLGGFLELQENMVVEFSYLGIVDKCKDGHHHHTCEM